MARPLIGQTAHEPRESQSRKKVWSPPNKLRTPTPPDGYKYRLVRRSIRGQEDTENVLGRIGQHYEPVSQEEVGDLPGYQSIEGGKHPGTAGVGDLMLMKVPEDVAEQRNAYYKNMTKRQDEAVNKDLLRENTKAMPITTNRKTEVELGTRRNVIAGDEE